MQRMGDNQGQYRAMLDLIFGKTDILRRFDRGIPYALYAKLPANEIILI